MTSPFSSWNSAKSAGSPSAKSAACYGFRMIHAVVQFGGAIGTEVAILLRLYVYVSIQAVVRGVWSFCGQVWHLQAG